jgi:hypothetical protein
MCCDLFTGGFQGFFTYLAETKKAKKPSFLRRWVSQMFPDCGENEEKRNQLLVTTFQTTVNDERGENYLHKLPKLKEYKKPSNVSQVLTFLFFWVCA